jgi:hypothetical protein
VTADITLYSGAKLTNIHPEGTCLLGVCSIHNPSDHPLRDAPMDWFGDNIRALVRVCEHGFRHPDPDDLRFKMATGDSITVEAMSSVHLVAENCDGCCTSSDMETRS